MLDEAFDAVGLGRAIRRRRTERGMTQQGLAEWLGVSRQTVVSLEKGGPVAVTIALRALALLGHVPSSGVTAIASSPGRHRSLSPP